MRQANLCCMGQYEKGKLGISAERCDGSNFVWRIARAMGADARNAAALGFFRQRNRFPPRDMAAVKRDIFRGAEFHDGRYGVGHFAAFRHKKSGL